METLALNKKQKENQEICDIINEVLKIKSKFNIILEQKFSLEYFQQNNIDIDIINFLHEIYEIFPDFEYTWEANIEQLQDSLWKYLDEKFKNQEIDKWFDFEYYNKFFWIQNWNIVANQTIWNCYLVSSLCAFLSNIYFLQKVSWEITSNKSKKITNLSWKYKDIDVNISDIFMYENWIWNIEEYLKNLKWDELLTFAKKIINSIIKNTKYKLTNNQKYNNSIPDFEYSEMKFNKYNNTDNLHYDKSLLLEVLYQIDKKTWRYYDYCIQFIKNNSRKNIVKWKHWLKILMTAFEKKIFWKIDLHNQNWGFTFSVFEFFLSDKDWLKLNHLSLKKTLNIIIFQEILNRFNSWKYIVVANVNEWVKSYWETQISLYFDYKGQELAKTHSYYIKKFDTEKQLITIINPWDTTKEIYIDYEDFIKIFDDINIAIKK